MIDETAIKLHVADSGEVWYAPGQHAPKSSGRVVEEFLDQYALQDDCLIRMVGTSRNAALISLLYEQRARLGIKRIELAGPQVCDTAAELANPEITLFRMRQCMLPGACGGWHVLTDKDYPAYVHTANFRPECDRLATLDKHPAWPALSFIGGVNKHAVAHILAEIMDPRWHVSPHNPDRIGRLRTFLGLTPRIAKQFERDCGGDVRIELLRYRSVLHSWATHIPVGEETERPEFFLWRWRDRREGLLGQLYACQKFAAFLRYTWLDYLHRDVQGGFFEPQRFFNRPDEAEAYVEHQRRFSAGV